MGTVNKVSMKLCFFDFVERLGWGDFSHSPHAHRKCRPGRLSLSPSLYGPSVSILACQSSIFFTDNSRFHSHQNPSLVPFFIKREPSLYTSYNTSTRAMHNVSSPTPLGFGPPGRSFLSHTPLPARSRSHSSAPLYYRIPSPSLAFLPSVLLSPLSMSFIAVCSHIVKKHKP